MEDHTAAGEFTVFTAPVLDSSDPAVFTDTVLDSSDPAVLQLELEPFSLITTLYVTMMKVRPDGSSEQLVWLQVSGSGSGPALWF